VSVSVVVAVLQVYFVSVLVSVVLGTVGMLVDDVLMVVGVVRMIMGHFVMGVLMVVGGIVFVFLIHVIFPFLVINEKPNHSGVGQPRPMTRDRCGEEPRRATMQRGSRKARRRRGAHFDSRRRAQDP
jgi:hypothetical protein